MDDGGAYGGCRMKKNHLFFQKWRSHLLVLCYSVYVVCVLAAALVGFVQDSFLKVQGQLSEKEVSVFSFQMQNLIAETENSWRSTTADPQLLYVVDGYLSNVSIKMQFDANPGELDLYYTQNADETFDKYRRVWAVQQPDGSYLYTLPRTKISVLRIDPGSAENLGITIEEIRFNTQTGPERYLDISLNGLFRLAVIPALSAAILKYLLHIFENVKSQVNKGKGSCE